jgi:transcription elongation factor Elf1
LSTFEQHQQSVVQPGGATAAADVARTGGKQYPLKPSDLKGYLANDFGWRNEVFKVLVEQESTATEAYDFLWCESAFRGVEVCSTDITHSRAIPITCHKRYCPHCARRESARLVANHTPQIKAIVDECPNKSYRLRRIELTTAIDIFDPDIDAKTDAAIEAVNRTFDSFCGSKLTESQRHRWSERSHKAYTGEALMFTIEFGEDGRKLHFHCLFFGRFIGKYDLSNVWLAMSGYSITWVQHVPKTEPGIREALKYVSKDIKPKTDPKTGEILPTLPNPKFIAQVAKVLKGRRRVFCRGAFRGLEDDISEPGADLGEIICKSCGGSAELVSVEFWADHLYARYLATLHRQLDLKPGNKSATNTESDVGSHGSGSSSPPTEQVKQASISLTDQMWEAYEAQQAAKKANKQ